MAKIRVLGKTRGPVTKLSLPDERGFKKHDEIQLGQYGHLERVPIQIEYDEHSPEKPRFFHFHASICSDENDQIGFASGYSRCGFLLGTHDGPTGEDANANRYFYTSIHPDGDDLDYHCVEKCGFSVDRPRWSFGRIATLVLKVEENRTSKQDILLFVRPFFPSAVDEIKLEIKTQAADRYGTSVKSWVHEVVFKKDKSAMRSIPPNEWYKEVGAFNWTGDGSSVHPKQLYTSFALNHTMQKYMEGKRNISIAYIGPDTTENLRTVIRTLSKIRAQTEFNVSLYVIYHQRWDVPRAVNPFAGTRLDLSNTPSWIQLQGISMEDLIDGKETVNVSKEFPGAQHELQQAFLRNPNVDLVIATYVTPWSIGANEESRVNYQKVIERLMDDRTKMVTIDPGKKEYCVISKPPEGTSKKDLSDFYNKRLNLKSSPILWNTDEDEDEEDTLISLYLWERGVS